MSNIYKALAELQKQVYADNVKAGWWTNLATGELKAKGDVTEILAKLALVHSEVSETVEGVRKDLMDDKIPHRKMAEVELADAVIRILDLCGQADMTWLVQLKRSVSTMQFDLTTRWNTVWLKVVKRLEYSQLPT